MKDFESSPTKEINTQENSEQVIPFEAQKSDQDIFEYGPDNNQDNPDRHNKSIENALLDKEKLKTVQKSYLEQYTENSDSAAEALLAKDNYDRYILEQLSGNKSSEFAKSKAFENYSRYIYSVAIDKSCSVNGRKFFPEFVTNPVLRNPEFSRRILKVNFDENYQEAEKSISNCRDSYKNELSTIHLHLKKREALPQEELDLLGDYLYSSKNYDKKAATDFACYLFNEGRQRKDLKATTEICGALTNYFAHEDSLDQRLKNTRIYIANHKSLDKTEEPISTGISFGKYIILEQNKINGIDLQSDKGLQRSRQSTFTDLYSLMMVTFHELTHSYQSLQAKDGKDNSSAMGYILNKILRKNANDCFPLVDENLQARQDENGKAMTGNYYKANHDNDEIEIQADEEAWRECRKFIHKHERQYNRVTNYELSKIATEHWIKCKDNEEEVNARRSFALKVNEQGVEMPYIQYDIEQLTESISRNPELLDTYPQLSNYFDKSGNIRPSIFFDREIASSNFDGLTTTTDNFGVEVATYALLSGKMTKSLANYISNPINNISSKQTKTCITNLWNTLHQPALKTRALRGINFENYQDTKTRGKYRELSEIRGSYFEQYLLELYDTIRISYSLKNKCPEMRQKIEDYESKYFTSYFAELAKGADVNPEFVAKAKKAYKESNQKILVKLAELL